MDLWLQIFQRVHSLEQLLGRLDLDAVKEAERAGGRMVLGIE